MRHRARLERIEQALRDMDRCTTTVTSRECPCCTESRVVQYGDVVTIVPRKSPSREAWAALVAQAPERCETWKHHHYHEESRHG
jgi:hypothetical protein